MVKIVFKQKFMKDKNYILLFFGNLVSGVGSRIYGFGISIFLLDLTGKASVMATYVSIWTFVIFLLSPIAATFTDKWKNKVRVLYVTDFGRGVVYFLVALLVWYFNGIGNITATLIVIYSALIFIAIQSAFFAPAVTAITPQLVEKEELVSASSIMQITHSIQNIVGLLFGALLYIKFGIVILMMINAVSFILSAISEMFIKYDTPKNIDRMVIKKDEFGNEIHEKHTLKDVFIDIKDSIKYLFQDGKPILMITLVILCSMTLTSPWFSVGLPYIIKEYFTYQGAIEPEYLLATSQLVESIGVILMSILVSQIASKFKIYQLLRIGGSLFIFVTLALIMVIRSYDIQLITVNLFIIGFVFVNFITGSVTGVVNAPINASMQKYIEPNKIGKVSMLIDSFGGILFPLSVLLTGYLIDNVSMYVPLYMMMASMLLITIISFKSKELQKLL